MPKRENDQNCNEKKKFIGNDYVSVIFNESGKPYRLGTISGKFAYVALEVILFLVTLFNYSSSL
uniref:Rap-GAP domain-containing protein n=1 Tax=Ascaris lumbricoides TaxID=6252 RepID=A0A0M3HLY7_ASCLU